MISFGCIPVCLGLGIMTMSNQHAHHRHAPDYPYLLIKGGPAWLPCMPPPCLVACIADGGSGLQRDAAQQDRTQPTREFVGAARRRVDGSLCLPAAPDSLRRRLRWALPAAKEFPWGPDPLFGVPK